jgi:hypothetical protein
MLRENAFYALGANPLYDREKLDDLLSRARLIGETEQAQKAHTHLVTMKMRLGEELRWLSGVTPQQTDAAKAALEDGFTTGAALDDMPALARANLMVTLLPPSLAALVRDVSFGDIFSDAIDAVAAIDGPSVLVLVNKDRKDAGWPLVQDIAQVQEKLALVEKDHARLLAGILNELPVGEQSAILTSLLEDRIDGGAKKAPKVLISLVDAYEKTVTAELLARQEEIGEQVAACYRLLDSSAQAQSFGAYVSEMVAGIYAWDAVAQPIQLCRRSQKLKHQPTVDLAKKAFQVAVRLHNDGGHTKASLKLVKCVADAFREERNVADDAHRHLEKIEEVLDLKRPHHQKNKSGWRKAVTWESKSRAGHLRISPGGVEYGNRNLSLDQIRSVQLMGGNSFGIQVGNRAETMRIATPSTKTLKAFVDRLIIAVGDEILFEWGEALGEGKKIPMGPVQLVDQGLVVSIPKFLRAPEIVVVPWQNIKLSTGGTGLSLSFYVGKPFEKFLSYFEVENAIFLGIAIKRLKESGTTLISELF